MSNGHSYHNTESGTITFSEWAANNNGPPPDWGLPDYDFEDPFPEPEPEPEAFTQAWLEDWLKEKARKKLRKKLLKLIPNRFPEEPFPPSPPKRRERGWDWDWKYPSVGRIIRDLPDIGRDPGGWIQGQSWGVEVRFDF